MSAVVAGSGAPRIERARALQSPACGASCAHTQVTESALGVVLTKLARRVGGAAAVVLAVIAASGCSHHAAQPRAGAASSLATVSSAPDPAPSPTLSHTTARVPAPSPTPAPSGRAGSVSPVVPVPLVTLPATPLTATGRFGTGVAVRVLHIAYGTVTGSGPGVLSGRPTVTFTLAITNGSPAPISIDTVQVNASYGSTATPAVAACCGDAQPFGGSLAAGRTATAAYAFAIPVPQQRDVELSVWYGQGVPTVVLTGSAR